VAAMHAPSLPKPTTESLLRLAIGRAASSIEKSSASYLAITRFSRFRRFGFVGCIAKVATIAAGMAQGRLRCVGWFREIRIAIKRGGCNGGRLLWFPSSGVRSRLAGGERRDGARTRSRGRPRYGGAGEGERGSVLIWISQFCEKTPCLPWTFGNTASPLWMNLLGQYFTTGLFYWGAVL
jgi:hypothetical protein